LQQNKYQNKRREGSMPRYLLQTMMYMDTWRKDLWEMSLGRGGPGKPISGRRKPPVKPRLEEDVFPDFANRNILYPRCTLYLHL
jgi:hypothetical protein